MITKLNIRQQVAWLTLIPMLILAVILGAFLLHGRFADLDQGMLERGKLIARQLASSSEYGVFSNNQAFLRNIVQGVLKQPDVRGVEILNAASEIMSNVVSPDGLQYDGTAPVAPSATGKAVTSPGGQLRDHVNFLSPISMDQHSIWIYQPIVPAQLALDDMDFHAPVQQLGAVIVEISRAQTETVKREILILSVLAIMLFLAVSFYLVHLASLSITSPILKLSKAVQDIAQGDLTTRVSLRTRVVELATLAQGFNVMTAQLQEEREVLQQRVDEATQALRGKKEEAERVSHDKSRFLAVASHDLRQPLHALGLYVAELQREVTGTQQQHLVGQVEQSVDALSTLLNALLDISKLDAGAVVPTIQVCDLNAMLSRVAADYQMLASIKNIRFVVSPCSCFVMSDPVLLERILMNLVSNAIRYTYQNGCVMIACRKRGNSMRIEVRDNGVGISAADQVNIFREFFQLAQPQLNSEKGLGLGLAIVERLAKLLGHHIEVRSAPGRGSMFALEALLAASPAGRAAVGDASVPDTRSRDDVVTLSGKKILVVDDDGLVLTSTSAIFSSWGGVVTTAASLGDVRALLDEGGEWDLVVSDYQLGHEETGIAVIDAVRHRCLRKPRCILISGDTSPAVLKLASVAGHHLLHKPVRPAKLRSLVLYLLDEIQAETTV